jgi:hypothetical protein
VDGASAVIWHFAEFVLDVAILVDFVAGQTTSK